MIYMAQLGDSTLPEDPSILKQLPMDIGDLCTWCLIQEILSCKKKVAHEIRQSSTTVFSVQREPP